jgi:hypothetical protein
MKYMKRRMKTLSDEEIFDFNNYIHQTFMKAESTENLIFICFEMGMWAIKPLSIE